MAGGQARTFSYEALIELFISFAQACRRQRFQPATTWSLFLDRTESLNVAANAANLLYVLSFRRETKA
jgi:hypothetical protein